MMTEKRKSTATGLPPLPPRNLHAEVAPGKGSNSALALAVKATRRAKAAKALNAATVASGVSQRPKGKRGRPAKPK